MKIKHLVGIIFLSCGTAFASSIIQPVSINQTAACNAQQPLQPICVPGGSITGMTSYCWSDGSCQTTAATGVGPGTIVPADISTTVTDNFTFPNNVTTTGRGIMNQLFVQTASANQSSATWVTRSDLTNGYKVDLSLDGYLQFKEANSGLQFYFTATNGTSFSNGSEAINMQPGGGTAGANRIGSGSSRALELASINGGVSILYKAGTAADSSGTGLLHSFNGIINQSGTAGYTGMLLNVTETTVGSGTKLLQDLQVGGTSKFSVSDAGVVNISSNTTGAGTPQLGTNSPATTNTAPYTWIVMHSSDGSTVYVPAWK